MTSATYPGEKKKNIQKPSGYTTNRRTTEDGQLQIRCLKCYTWKDAVDANFYKHAGHYRSPCRPCAETMRRPKRKCKHEGCDAAVAIENKTGYCRKHIGDARTEIPKLHCANCGKVIKHQNVTGLCHDCYISTGKILEVSFTNGRPAEGERPPEFYSGLGDLPEPMGFAPSNPGRFWRER